MKKQILILLTALMLSLGASAQMVLQFDTNLSDGTTVTLPLQGTVNATVNWAMAVATLTPKQGTKTTPTQQRVPIP